MLVLKQIIDHLKQLLLEVMSRIEIKAIQTSAIKKIAKCLKVLKQLISLFLKMVQLNFLLKGEEITKRT